MWERALAELQAANAREAAEGNAGGHINGFYEEKRPYSGPRKHQYLFIRKQYQAGEALHNKAYEMYRVIVPNLGLIWYEQRTALDDRTTYAKFDLGSDGSRARAQREWTQLHRDAEKCYHVQPCRKHYGNCAVGRKFIDEAIITGAILPLWKALDELTTELTASTRGPKHMRVTRVRLSDGQRMVGVKVPYHRLKNWKGRLMRAGVAIDREALGAIDIVEKDAEQTATRSRADRDETSAMHGKSEGPGGSGAAAGDGNGTPADGAGSGRRKRKAEGLGRREMNLDYW